MRRFLPDSPDFAWAYDNEREPPGHIRGALSRYDRRLVLRWNRLLQRWEVWRMRSLYVPPRFAGIPPEEISKRMTFWFPVGDDDRMLDDHGFPIGEQPHHPPLDGRIFPNAWTADTWRRLDCSAAELNAMIGEQEEAEKRKALAAEKEQLRDFIMDHKNQLYALKDAHSMEHILHGSRSKDPTRAFGP